MIDGFYECGFGSDVVLWDTKHCPASVRKLPSDPKVSFSVSAYLVHPELAAQSRVLAAFRATVPEASVNKNHDPSSGEYHVRVSRKPLTSGGLVAFMGEVPYPSIPQSRSQGSLGPVLPRLCAMAR